VKLARSALVVLLSGNALLLSACAGSTAPAAQVAQLRAAATGVDRWFDPESLALTQLLPPVPDAAATQRELESLLQNQAVRTAADCERAQQDVKKNLSRFAPALGLTVEADDSRLSATDKLLSDLRTLQEAITSRSKDETRRLRPYEQDARVTTCIDRPGSGSYPSGHAAWGMAAALLLADLVPERRAALLVKAHEFGESRLVGGVHYRSDIDAGRTAGTLIAAFLLASPRYRAEAAAAAAGLRAALGLPP
jgi:acid phosphatase (class A)